MRAWMFSSVMSGVRPSNTGRQGVEVRGEYVFDGKQLQGEAEVPRKPAGVRHAALGGIAGGQAKHVHLVRPEGLHGKDRHQRGVDPAGEPEVHAREPALAHVVPDAQDQGAFDLGPRVRGQRDLGARGGRCPRTASSSSNAVPMCTSFPSREVTMDWPSKMRLSFAPDDVHVHDGHPGGLPDPGEELQARARLPRMKRGRRGGRR